MSQASSQSEHLRNLKRDLQDLSERFRVVVSYELIAAGMKKEEVLKIIEKLEEAANAGNNVEFDKKIEKISALIRKRTKMNRDKIHEIKKYSTYNRLVKKLGQLIDEVDEATSSSTSSRSPASESKLT